MVVYRGEIQIQRLLDQRNSVNLKFDRDEVTYQDHGTKTAANIGYDYMFELKRIFIARENK